MKHICIILGTRPEIIKLSSLIRLCSKDKDIKLSLVHTNQHYSRELDEIFFKDLNLPTPNYNLNIGSGSRGWQVGKIIIELEKVLEKLKPDLVLVQGDTNTVLGGAICSAKLNLPLGHIEAGLRSYDRSMPEEINRVLTDHCSEILFAPTIDSKKILIKENIPEEKIFVTGNTIVDAVMQNSKLVKDKTQVLLHNNLKKDNYFLLTLHRAENVDDKKRFQALVETLASVYKRYNFPIIFPLHPRTRKMIQKFELELPAGIKLIKPQSYLNFLKLQKNARLILTDSGGVQEEACILGKPCVTLRDNTERPETVAVGSNLVSGIEARSVLTAIDQMMKSKKNWENPFGDGKSAKKIMKISLNYLDSKEG